MSDTDRFDAIVVDAGPAGIACAYTLAREGKAVLVIERGTTPGSKNLTGGRLYTYALDLVEPGLWREAALERRVTHERIMVLQGDRAINIEYQNPGYNQINDRPQSFTILRAVFDEWFAGQAEEMGAIIACGIRVDDLVEEDGRVVGVRAGDDELLADVVVAADGVNSFIAQKGGLFPDITAGSVGVGVKEVIKLPAEKLEERFSLTQDEGTATMLLGCTDGIHGGGFMYTNRESISLGCVFKPEEVSRHGHSIHEIFQNLKLHPAINQLIRDGETVEYGAHLVSETGYRGVPDRLFKDGLLVTGDAAGFVINTGSSIRGMDLAIVSGVGAARAILAETGTSGLGPRYVMELKKLGLIPTMKAADGYFDLLEIPRIYSSYPSTVIDLFDRLFTVNGEVPVSMVKHMKTALKSNHISRFDLIKDAIRGYKAL